MTAANEDLYRYVLALLNRFYSTVPFSCKQAAHIIEVSGHFSFVFFFFYSIPRHFFFLRRILYILMS